MTLSWCFRLCTLSGSLGKQPFLLPFSLQRDVCVLAAEIPYWWHDKSGSHGVPKVNLFNFTFFSWSILVKYYVANELQQNFNAPSREDCIPQILTVLLEILRIYIWPLWPFVFCLSFVNNSLNNVPTSSTNQRFWLDSRQILCHQYGISVTELQPLIFRAKRPQQRRASRNRCFCRLLSSKVSWFGHYALVNSRCTHALPGQLLGI